MSVERPVKLYVSADQIHVDDDVAYVEFTFEVMEDIARRFLRALSGERPTEG